MRTKRSFVLAATALIVAVVAGGEAVADRHGGGRVAKSPGHDQHGQPSQGQPSQPDPAKGDAGTFEGDETDRAFVNGMAAHHHAAVEMAHVVIKRGWDRKVRTLAQSIIDDQRNEIRWMNNYAEQKWGSRPSTARPGPMGVLMGMRILMDMSAMADHMSRTENVDRMFMEMMIPHHAAAISMAQEEIDRGSDPRIVRMARTVISTQSREIGMMQKLLDQGVPGATR